MGPGAKQWEGVGGLEGTFHLSSVELDNHLLETLWTVARQAPLSMEFSKQEYWSGLPFPSPGDLTHPGIEPGSPALQADSLTSEPPGKPTHLLGNINAASWLHYR